MELKLFYSTKNMVVRLVNVDGVDSIKQFNRVLDSWMQPNGTNLRVTHWQNDSINELNPHKYNRVNVHLTNQKGNTVTQSYYCIHDYIQLEEMTFRNFDESVLL
tara:strand:+ start:277 stop:588 length:312 start_codon:yes stop_codon:yes gene_type:complete